ncbi:MAG: iron-sulfur cluster biosynthesis transcriptional regulator SufR [Synechococcaceae cyanobacterium]|nr:iron-sulfur cluster biosynthesis transcriptional regulator SufR [Synechococcaceae cyanobacterium]
MRIPSLSTAAAVLTATDATTPNDQSTASRDASPTREAVLALLLRHGEATAAALAELLHVSVQAMRRHLRSLEDDGLVEASPAVEGPGRPSNRWRLTDAGRDRFHDGSEHFALGLMQTMASTMPAEAMQQMLSRQAERKAADYRRLLGEGTLAERIARLVDLRRSEGYVAESRRDDDEPDSWLIQEFHCSVMRIAEEFPMVCDQELELMRRTFPDCQVERVHWRLEEGHSCGFQLRPRPSGAPSSGH